MAFELSYLERDHIALACFWGRLDLEQFLEYERQIMALDARTETVPKLLFVLHPGTEIVLTGDELRDRAKVPKLEPRALRAVVAPDDLSYGLARLYASEFRKGEHYAIFKDLESACELLGADAAEVKRNLPEAFPGL